MAGFIEAGRFDEIEDGRAIGLEVEGLPLAIFRDGDRAFALLGRCPHAGGAMATGWVEDGEAVCPLHRWRFRLASGRCTTGGPGLHRFDCEIRDGRVWVAV